MPKEPSIVALTARFLRQFEPFSRMDGTDLDELAGQLKLAYYPAGAVVLEAEQSSGLALHIIQSGHVRAGPIGRPDREVILGPGECFPLGDLDAVCYVATEDAFCYLLEAEQVKALRRQSVIFDQFCGAALASVLHSAMQQMHSGFLGRALRAETLLQPLAKLLRAEPVSCGPEAPLREALTRMSRAGVGTIAVTDTVGRPLGIFTLTDLMERVVLQDLALSTPVGAVMTAAPVSVRETASAQDAIALLASGGLHQLLVTRDSRLVGVISERDLFALQRVSVGSVLQRIGAARDEQELSSTLPAVVELTDNLMAQGISAEHLMRIVTSLHDALSERLIGQIANRFALDDIRWCWLALGSEGRREQTLLTDQDNALVFVAAGADAAVLRSRLLPFTRAVNEALAAIGVPLCPGNIMAGNPQCCLSDAEWRAQFLNWIREPTPEALLQANIFFDLRPLAGDAALGEALRGWVLDRTVDNQLFLGLLVANALQAEPPLGLIRSFRTDETQHPGTIDLKGQGTRLFVDAGRVLALAFGIEATSTAERVRQGVRRLGLPERDLEGLLQGFGFLQLLRFRQQRSPAARDGSSQEPTNRLDPYALSDPDQRSLKEAFRQARFLQSLISQLGPH